VELGDECHEQRSTANNNNNAAATAAAATEGSQTDLASSSTNTASNGNAAKLKATPEPYNPLKQLLVTIEHKIRNLEKRKVSVLGGRA